MRVQRYKDRKKISRFGSAGTEFTIKAGRDHLSVSFPWQLPVATHKIIQTLMRGSKITLVLAQDKIV